MGLFVGGVPVEQVYVGSTPVREVYVGSEKIWPVSPARETVQISLGDGNVSRNQLRAALSARGLNYWSVTEIPFEIELVGSGSASSMFNGYSSLIHAPVMDTSQVTDMSNMFYRCWSLAHVPDMDTSSVTRMSHTFQSCESLTDGNVRLIGRHPDVDTTSMINGSGLTREPFYNADGSPASETVQITLGAGTQARDQLRAALSARLLNYQTVTEIPFDIELVGMGSIRDMFNACASLTHAPEMNTSSVTDMRYMFYNCSSLTTVPGMDTSQVTNTSYMFYSCSSLTDGSVRLIGRHQRVNTANMITDSGLTREPFYDTIGNPI